MRRVEYIAVVLKQCLLYLQYHTNDITLLPENIFLVLTVSHCITRGDELGMLSIIVKLLHMTKCGMLK
jgi:hypothetical protein